MKKFLLRRIPNEYWDPEYAFYVLLSLFQGVIFSFGLAVCVVISSLLEPAYSPGTSVLVLIAMIPVLQGYVLVRFWFEGDRFSSEDS